MPRKIGIIAVASTALLGFGQNHCLCVDAFSLSTAVATSSTLTRCSFADIRGHPQRQKLSYAVNKCCLHSTSSPDEVSATKEVAPATADEPDSDSKSSERERLKKALIALGASYDRGYGASPSSRKDVDRIITQLEEMNPTSDAARGISGDASTNPGDGPPPLQGIWRMVWTTAQDVLTLAASPVATVGAIYQVIEPPIATNIIDFIPRAQALLPPGVAPPTLIRAEVTTRASPRAGNPLRVGLNFEAVKIQPVEVFGLSATSLPPLSFNLPGIDASKLPGVDPDNPPGYFDVAYLDDELLIIKQNQPGGVFALVKAESYDP